MPSVFEIKNDEITARESFSIIPLRSPSFESINQATRIRIIRILSKIVDIWREQWITRDHFKIQIKWTDVILSPKVSAVARILNGAEQYITDTIIGESESDPDYNIEYRRKADC